ncbi:MAG: helix-turn-helix transcriptional regulator [Clostridium sp.]
MENNIKQIIAKNDLKVKKVISDSGLSKTAFYLIVNGESIPSLINARRISNALGLTVEEVFPDQNFIKV